MAVLVNLTVSFKITPGSAPNKSDGALAEIVVSLLASKSKNLKAGVPGIVEMLVKFVGGDAGAGSGNMRSFSISMDLFGA